MTNVKLYTVKEAAKIVGVSTNTLYKYLDEDRIHAARGSAIQGRFRIPESALEEFLGISLSDQGNSEPQAELADVSEVGQTTTTVPLTSPDNRLTESPISPQKSHLPLKIVRFLLILALFAILIDLVLSPTLNLAGTLTRLFFVAIMILLSYQEGGYRKG